jgi:hypothetical protein
MTTTARTQGVPVSDYRHLDDAAQPASTARRFLAGLVDLFLLAVPVTVALLADQRLLAVAAALLAVVVVLVQWVLHGALGWTVGRRAAGIRTLDVESRLPIGLGRVLLRGLILLAGLLALGVGLLVVLASPLFDRTGRRRGWLDLAARDEVLDVRAVLRDERPSPVPVARAHVPQPAAPPRRVATVPEWAVATPPTDAAGTSLLDELLDAGRPAALVLAPVSPQRSGPDLDTRATPVVRQVGLSYGLAPELEMTRPAGPRDDLLAQPTDSVAVDRTVAEVELSDGRRITIERTALVGRNPASDADVQLVRVVDPGRSVSKTHLQIGVEPGGVWVADRGSTNGTVVTLPDGGQVVCRVDQQVRLRVGSTVTFGDCALRLVRAPGSQPVS